jgi:membrane associated rhomboid family serine protease
MNCVDILLLIFIVIFLLQQIFPIIEYLFTLIPKRTIFEPWRIFTSIFLHADLLHLFYNSWAFYIFGKELEKRVGSKKFLIIFLLSGIFSSFFYFILAYFIDPETPALGASGAIYGIIGSLAIISPTLYVIVYFIPVPLLFFALFYALFEFIGTVLFLFGVKSSIAYAAHFAGIIIGFLLGKKEKELRFEE